MKPTTASRALGGDLDMNSGVRPPTVRPGYSSYKSPHGPKYTIQPNVAGMTAKGFTRLGMTLGAFGGVAGFFALYFFSDVPRVKRDIIVKIPIIGPHFVKEIPASDNPF